MHSVHSSAPGPEKVAKIRVPPRATQRIEEVNAGRTPISQCLTHGKGPADRSTLPGGVGTGGICVVPIPRWASS